MKYEIEIKDEAKIELRKLPDDVRREIGYRLHLLQQDFSGDVKKLKGSKNEYRCVSAATACYLNWSAGGLWFIH